MINRRHFLKQTGTLASGVAALSGMPQFFFKRNLGDKIIGHGDYRYKIDKSWAQVSSVHTPILNCHEMVMDRNKRLIMIGDDTHNNLLVFDQSGKLLDQWGSQYPGGHGLTLAEEGEEDVLFIVDCGWYLDRAGKWQKQAGRVVKTDINGRLIFNLGHPATLGIYKTDEPFMPTEVAVAPNGDFYVADGYGSDYIIQYDHQGKYIRHFGGHHNENPDHNINNAHGVAIDQRDPANPKLIVTSRNEYCFKFFTLDGKYLSTVKLPGAFVCRPVIDGENIYAGVCWSVTREGKKWFPNTGFVTILDGENKVVSNPGGKAPVYEAGSLQQLYQAEDPDFFHCHDVCVDQDKNLYICQWNARKSPPVKLVRV
ncbi:MAG: 6-bladed beta-propeller [Bacteroidota bacterium]